MSLARKGVARYEESGLGRRRPVLVVDELDDDWDARFLDDEEVVVLPLEEWKNLVGQVG